MASLHMSHVDLVIKINCARLRWHDQRELKAGFGKDQALRRRGNVERPEYRGQIPQSTLGFESDLSGIDAMLELRNRIRCLCLRIGNEAMIKVGIRLRK